jgi:hypothetical protein
MANDESLPRARFATTSVALPRAPWSEVTGSMRSRASHKRVVFGSLGVGEREATRSSSARASRAIRSVSHPGETSRCSECMAISIEPDEREWTCVCTRAGVSSDYRMNCFGSRRSSRT